MAISQHRRTRTTVSLSSDLHQEARRVAAASGRTLGAVVEDALRESFSRHEPPAKNGARPFRVVTFTGTGPAPGVNLSDTSELLLLASSDAGFADP